MSLNPPENPFARVDPRVYKAGRPAYASAASAHLSEVLLSAFGRLPIDRALDVGAGTGIFTRLLVPFAEHVVAADPVAESLSHMELPEIETLCCPAERLSVPDRSFDLVTCANAFHWTERGRALSEMARALRPGGVLVIAWNLPIGFHRGPFEPVAERILHDNPGWITHKVEQLTGWNELLASPDFEDLSRIEWPLTFDWGAAEVLEFYKSTSFAGGDIPEDKRPALWAEMAAALEIIASPTVPCQFLTRLEIARRRRDR